MSNARFNAINSISARLNSKLSNLEFDSEGEVWSILDDVYDMLRLKHAKLERLKIARENVERKYGELTAETEELKGQIEAMKREIKLEKASKKSMMEEAKRLKLDSFFFDAIAAALAARGLLPAHF